MSRIVGKDTKITVCVITVAKEKKMLDTEVVVPA